MVTILLMACLNVNYALWCGNPRHNMSYDKESYTPIFLEFDYYPVSEATQDVVVTTLYNGGKPLPTKKVGCEIKMGNATFYSDEKCSRIVQEIE